MTRYFALAIITCNLLIAGANAANGADRRPRPDGTAAAANGADTAADANAPQDGVADDSPDQSEPAQA